MKTLLSQMTGVAEPLPGIFTFHLTWLVSLQVVGGLAKGATPLASGPRHCGQFWRAGLDVSALIFASMIPQTVVITLVRRRIFTRAGCMGLRIFQIFLNAAFQR